MKKIILALVMICAVTLSSFAQGKAEADYTARAKKSLTFLMKDIKVTDAQKDELTKLTIDRETKMGNLYKDKSISADERKAQVAELNADYKKAVNKIIGNDQMAQWNANTKEYQAYMKYNAQVNMKLKEMLKDINVTPAQKNQIYDLAMQYEKNAAEINKDKSLDAAGKKSARWDNKKKYFASVIAIIGQDQKAQWEANDKALWEKMKAAKNK